MLRTFLKYLISLFIILNLFSASHAQDKTESKNFEIDNIEIEFKGSRTFDESEIEQIIASQEGDIYEVASYLKDVERIKKFYFDRGFFDAAVDTSIVYKYSDGEVDEKFIVTEKNRYVYYEINYNGIDSVDQLTREKILRPADKLLYKGRAYTKDSVTLELNRVLNVLFNNGYATATSKNPEVLKYETNDQILKYKVNIELYFSPNYKYFFGKTTVTFPKKKYNVTKEDILRELTYDENQVYNKGEVVNSELNLSKISLIDNPRIVIDSIDNVNRKVNLAINAVINNKYDLTPEAFGYYFQQVFYLGAGISYSDKNFLGGGRVLTSRLRFYFHSFKDNRLEFVNTIYQPFLFNNRNITGTWNIGAEYRLDELANITQINNSFGVSYDLPNYTYINKINSKWEIKNIKVILKQDITEDTVTLKGFDANYFTSTISVGAVHNSTNNIQFPSKGFYQSYEIEESGLLGGLVRKWFNTATLSYFKFTNFNSAYYNLSSDEINVSSALAGKFSTGIILEYGDNSFSINGKRVESDRVPNDKKFVSGGSSSVRGWGAKQLGIVNEKKIGGNFIVESSIEHRLRPFLNSNNSYIRDLGFATFIDAGNVWSEIGKFKFNELALAAGAGIRYYTIIGAIRFDIGFKIYDPQPGIVGGSNWIIGKGSSLRDKYNFQFGIGNTF
ncbi:MAG: BamA/TamA family outer membrane protein [Ignavibacteria bacterium]